MDGMYHDGDRQVADPAMTIRWQATGAEVTLPMSLWVRREVGAPLLAWMTGDDWPETLDDHQWLHLVAKLLDRLLGVTP